MKKHIKYSLLALFLLVISLTLISCAKSEISVVFMVDGKRYSTVTAYTDEEVSMPKDPVKDEHVFEGWFLDSGKWSMPFDKDFLVGKEYSDDLYVYAKWSYLHTHTPGDFIISVPSTCTEEGVRITKCIYCEEVLESEAAPLLPHTEVIVAGYEATETNDGLSDGSYCSVCNTIVRSPDKIPALIQGAELKSELFEINGDTLSLVLPNSENEISITENLKVNYNAAVFIFCDIEGQIPTENTVPLSEGDNLFYITVTNGEESRVYEIIIRRRPNYTLTFFLDNEEVAKIKVEENSLASAPDLDISKKGYTLEGWDYDFEIPVTEDASISAVWIPNRDTPYTVEHYVIDSDGSASLYSTENLAGTTDSSVTAEFIEIENHVYAEDISTSSGNIAADGTLVLKLYYKSTLVTVRFDTGCDVTIDEVKATLNSTIEAPQKISYSDLEFMGWYLEGEIWNFDTDTVTESITLTAKWGYRVTFILEGAESYILVEAGKTFKTTDAPQKKNAKIEWYISGTNELWKYNMPVTKHVTLVAKVFMTTEKDENAPT